MELTLEIPAGVKVSVLGELDHEMVGGKLRVSLGSLVAGQPMVVYLSLVTPPAGPEAELTVRGRVMGHGETGEIMESQAEVGFRWVNPEEVRLQPARGELLGRAALVILEDAVSRRSNWNGTAKGRKPPDC